MRSHGTELIAAVHQCDFLPLTKKDRTLWDAGVREDNRSHPRLCARAKIWSATSDAPILAIRRPFPFYALASDGIMDEENLE